MNENMEMNNEVMEVSEEVVQTGSGNGFKMFGGALAIAGLAYGGYRLFKKIRGKQKYADIPKNDCDSENECVSEVE